MTVERAGDDVRIDVRDHGPGLPTADADALFDRFWRAEGGRERGKAGAGLGLAIVAGSSRPTTAACSAEDAAGGGARFTVSCRWRRSSARRRVRSRGRGP